MVVTFDTVIEADKSVTFDTVTEVDKSIPSETVVTLRVRRSELVFRF